LNQLADDLENIQSRRNRFLPLIAVLLALMLRCAAALTDSIHHADEIGQYLDQAHRLVFGYGALPWEYRSEMRSWLIPLFLSGPMMLGHIIAPDTGLYLTLTKLVVAFVSLPILWAAWTFGRLVSKDHGWIAFWVAAIWFEFIFFAGHVLSEPLALAALLPAVALLLNDNSGRWHFFAAGFLLALSAVLRFHYGPAILLLVVCLCWKNWRVSLPAVVGGAFLLLVVSGGIDLAMGQSPFKWIFNNVYLNVVANRADAYGTSGPLSYFAGLRSWWGLIGTGALLLLAFDGRKLHPKLNILFWVAVTNFALHSLIGHKEYRFILLSTAIIVFLAAIGSLDIAQRAARKWSQGTTKFSLVATAFLWITASAWLAFTPPMNYRWQSYGGMIELMAKARVTPEICAIGLDQDYWYSGSYAVLHRPIPLYVTSTSDPSQMSSNTPINGTQAYNAVIAQRSRGLSLAGSYSPIVCIPHQTEEGFVVRSGRREDICLFQRKGGCSGGGFEKFQINTWLKDHNL
jgi:GPI mannosyltransferase 3